MGWSSWSQGCIPGHTGPFHLRAEEPQWPQAHVQHISALLLHPALQCCSRSRAGSQAMKGRGSGTPPQHQSCQGLRGDSLGSANTHSVEAGEQQGTASPLRPPKRKHHLKSNCKPPTTDAAPATQHCHCKVQKSSPELPTSLLSPSPGRKGKSQPCSS